MVSQALAFIALILSANGNGENPTAVAVKPKQNYRAVYVKVILPMKRRATGPAPRVETWIAKHLRRDIDDLRAVTGWVRLPEYDENDSVHVWGASVDGKAWGCPVGGSLLKRIDKHRVGVELNGWTPVGATLSGNSLQDELGGRTVGAVNFGDAKNRAFFAIVIGPPLSK